MHRVHVQLLLELTRNAAASAMCLDTALEAAEDIAVASIGRFEPMIL